MAKAAKMTASTQEMQRQLDKMQRHAAAYKAGPQVMLGLTTRLANIKPDTNRGKHPNSRLVWELNGKLGQLRWAHTAVQQLTKGSAFRGSKGKSNTAIDAAVARVQKDLARLQRLVSTAYYAQIEANRSKSK